MTKKRFTYLDASRNKYIGSFFCNSVPLTNDEVVELLNTLNNENEQLKQKITELDSENEKLWETCYHSLQFARNEDITIKRDDKGHYNVYSKNVIPHDSPIISITAPSVLFNEYIINHIIEAIDKIPPVHEKEEITDD